MTISSSFFISRAPPLYRSHSCLYTKPSSYSAVYKPPCGMMIKASSEPQEREIFVEPGTTFNLKVTCPLKQFDEKKMPREATSSQTEPKSTSIASQDGKTFSEYLAAYTLMGICKLDRTFGNGFVVAVLTDGVSNSVNEVNLCWVLKRLFSSNPKLLSMIVRVAPVLNLLGSAIALAAVQRLILNAANGELPAPPAADGALAVRNEAVAAGVGSTAVGVVTASDGLQPPVNGAVTAAPPGADGALLSTEAAGVDASDDVTSKADGETTEEDDPP